MSNVSLFCDIIKWLAWFLNLSRDMHLYYFRKFSRNIITGKNLCIIQTLYFILFSKVPLIISTHLLTN